MSISDLGKIAGAAKAAKAAKTAGDAAKTASAASGVANAAAAAQSAAGAAGRTASKIPGIPARPPRTPSVPSAPSIATRKTGTPNFPKLGSPSGRSATVVVSEDASVDVPAAESGPTTVRLQSEPIATTDGPPKTVAKTTLKEDIRNAAVGGGSPTNGQKQSMRAASLEVASAAAKGAVGGAAAGLAAGGVGAIPGAIVGAAKDAGLAIIKNKRYRGIVISVVAFLVVIPMVFSLVSFLTLSTALSAITQSNNAASQVAAGAQIENDAIAASIARQEQYGVPWTILASMETKGFNTPESFTNVGSKLAEIDPNGISRVMDAGGTYAVGSAGRIVNEGDKVASASSTQVRNVYVAALVAGTPTDQKTAEAIYDQALRWALGQEVACAPANAPAGGDVTLNVKGVPATNAQLDIAATIVGITKTVTAAMDPADQVRAAEIAMATGIVESVLTNHGEKVDHTSLGVFQQQDWWGTDEQRTRPDWATARFLKPLLLLAGWNTMDPGVAAQKIQISAFPDEYSKRMGEAKILVSNLWNTSSALPLPADIDMGAAAPTEGAPVNTGCLVPSTGTFVLPFVGFTPQINSWFGPRVSPGGIGSTNHGGVDFGAPTGTPVVSIGDGVVNGVGTNRYAGCGFWITVEMPDGIARYCHFNVVSPMKVGDAVVAGQPIGVVGSTGNSTGPHLHLNIDVNGSPVDPYYFLFDRGIDLAKLPYWSVAGPH